MVQLSLCAYICAGGYLRRCWRLDDRKEDRVEAGTAGAWVRIPPELIRQCVVWKGQTEKIKLSCSAEAKLSYTPRQWKRSSRADVRLMCSVSLCESASPCFLPLWFIQSHLQLKAQIKPWALISWGSVPVSFNDSTDANMQQFWVSHRKSLFSACMSHWVLCECDKHFEYHVTVLFCSLDLHKHANSK